MWGVYTKDVWHIGDMAWYVCGVVYIFDTCGIWCVGCVVYGIWVCVV